MDFELIDYHHKLWEELIAYTKNCSWKTAEKMGRLMQEKTFADWERVLVAVENGDIKAFCTLTKKDSYPELPYSPFIGFLFVSEEVRGNRLSGKLIEQGTSYLRGCGFKTVYIVSGHAGLYETYGFSKIDTLKRTNEVETVFSKDL